ncbi:MAG: DUF2914 domain-containing protein [candidate division KSB1 bacterium]|nr:DUF2914 domain-containing protein [candidate division KSB1 bacterium]MDZ7272980.1 DUF2914 domain-containing protein [candidate division KSB1 bacterium]MDZ7285084.1 DUF2914 domain-containing protein [candidate division KSB1 bacterium]MDZ7298116.1 DUF2914 domain-containing protein [candidate division KSB1 bacterium]MDZ7309330.1 DUF2914 domain-containing protein [candidate division KSB1 bacterium]
MKPLRIVLTLPVLVLLPHTPAAAQEADSIRVNRLVICTAVVEREPSGEATAFDATTPMLYCFTELDGAAGEVTHAWFQGDSLRAEVKLHKGRAGRWRTWSSKTMSSEATGAWKVEVRDATGHVLKSTNFTFGKTE